MIAKLKGLLDSIGEDWAVIDVSGVGYLVFASSRCLAKLPEIGHSLTLFIETHVREDHIHLYGFSGEVERSWFRLLLTVQGVGSKVALALLSAMTPQELSQAILSGDKSSLSRAQGVGPKLAVRLTTELKEKASMVMPSFHRQTAGSGSNPEMNKDQTLLDDAISALVNLGYRRSEAYATLVRLLETHPDKLDTATLIRLGLRALAQETNR
jgi:Holliday junction DNA helicase RuvA